MKRFVLKRRFGYVRMRSFFAAGFALLAAAPFATAQQIALPPAAVTVALPETLPTEFDGDLRFLPPVYMPPPYRLLNEGEPPPVNIPPQSQMSIPAQPSVQILAPMPAPTANFRGLGLSDSVTGGQAGGGWPPDTNGDVGPIYYIQSVNTAIGIFTKATGIEKTAFTINQLWSVSGTSTQCLNQNAGDPVVLHDARNDRWVITDFAFGFSGGNPVSPFYECIAVSKTGDPVGGGWYFYAVRMDTGASGGPPSGTLNDYPKFGLWNDGCLYMGANGFVGNSYTGSIVASFSTTDMYAGNALTSSVGWLAYNGSTGQEFGLFPADLLGRSADSLPPSGRSEYFASESFAPYAFDVRTFTPGSNCGAGGALSAATRVPQTGGYTINQGHTIPQPGTSNLLDSLGFRLMQRVQYRKIGGAESLWLVHTIGNPTQPQWAQINVSGGIINTTPVQQQIYAPDNTEHRWMPSLAVDGLGDMAMGYSRSSGTAGDYPSLYYAGRLAGDAANQLPQSEVALVTGGGSQTNACGTLNPCYRWGDYSSMTIDPSDDCTFWYTNEYYDTQANGTAGNWQTRIGSFKFPGCNSYTLTYTTDGNGAISGTTPQTVITGGSGTAVTAVPNATYRFVQWSDASTANPRTDTNVTANISVQAQFVATYTIGGSVGGLTGANTVGLTLTDTTTSTTQVQSYGNGNFTFPTALNSGDNWNVAVTAQPTGQTCGVSNGSGTNLSANVTNVTVTCTTNTYTLTYTTDGNGTISGTTPQTVNYNTSGSAVTAVPNAGYHFVQWSDASTVNPRTDTNVTTSISVQAQFAANVLVFTTQPSNLAQRSALGTIAVTEQDGSGGTVSDTATVDFTVAPTSCGTFDLGSVQMVNGVATLNSAQQFYTAASNLKITATVTNPNPTPMASVQSSAFNVTQNADFVFTNGFEVCTP